MAMCVRGILAGGGRYGLDVGRDSGSMSNARRQVRTAPASLQRLAAASLARLSEDVGTWTLQLMHRRHQHHAPFASRRNDSA